MSRTTIALSLLVASVSGLAYACGDIGASAFDSRGADGTETTPPNAAGTASDAGAPPTSRDNEPLVDNAVILVHAAKSQAFRLCFGNEKELDRRPQPDSEVMPEANVVGVEVGAAVRIGPLAGKPGDVYLFEEPLIRAYYPAFGGAGSGPSCRSLLSNPSLGNLAIKIGTVDVDLATGVHLLVVKGCPANSPLRTFGVGQCGADWTAAKGNLAVKEIGLSAIKRTGADVLPAQVVNLSQQLEGQRAGRSLIVSFGNADDTGAPRATVATNPVPFGDPSPDQPAKLSYTSSDTAIYETLGFRVAFATTPPDAGVDAGADAGSDAGVVVTTVLDQSLARIQKLSSPRDVPPTYFAAASSFALLLLGDPTVAPGAGADEERQSLHFIAIPIALPKTDAGPPNPAPPEEPVDGG